MELNDVFMADPFLTLDNDLDDVSEVIRSNMVGENCDYTVKHNDKIQKQQLDESKMPQQYVHGFVPHQPRDSEERSKQIGEIVSLLQNDTMLHNTTVAHPNSAIRNESVVQQQQQQSAENVGQTQTNPSVYYNQQKANQVQQQLMTNQQYFIDPNGSDVNFAAITSPMDKNQFIYPNEPHSAFADQSHSVKDALPSAGAFLVHSPSENVFSQQPQENLNLFDNETTHQRQFNEFRLPIFNTNLHDEIFDQRTLTDQEEIVMKSVEDPSHVMLHSGLSDEMLHVSKISEEMPHFSSNCVTNTNTNSNSNSMPSPSLSDLFPAGDVFPPVNSAHFYLEDTSPSPPAVCSHAHSHATQYPGVEQAFFAEHQSPQHLQYSHQPTSYVAQEIKLRLPREHNARNTVIDSDDGLNQNDFESDMLVGYDSENLNSKSDLIRMLLEMSHTELETLRLSRNNSASDIAITIMENRANLMRSKAQKEQQKTSTASLPPLESLQTFAQQEQLIRQQGQQQHEQQHRQKLQQQQRQQQQQVLRQVKEETKRGGKRKTADKKLSTTLLPDAISELNTLMNSNSTPKLELPKTTADFELMMNNTSYNSSIFTTKSEESDEETDTEQSAHTHQQNASNSSLMKRGPKTERRTAHNLIEKKYRCSINDRINHLKTMLASDETKLSKSATLRKAIEHINMLRAQNMDLSHENRQLRALLDTAGLHADVPASAVYTNLTMPPIGVSMKKDATNVSSFQLQAMQQNSQNSKTNSSSESSPASASPLIRSPSSILHPDTVRAEAASKTPVKKKLLAQQSQKISLCIFMFVMMAFNPLSLLISSSSNTFDKANENSIEPHVYAHHRTLGSVTEELDSLNHNGEQIINGDILRKSITSWLQESIIHRCFIWLVNTLIVTFVLMRLFIYTEPVVDDQSAVWRAFLASKQRAIVAVSAKNYREAQRQLCDALQLIGREIPNAGSVEELFSVIWQVVCHLLNSLWVGRWLARRRRSATQPSAAVCRSHAATALVYHQIHQLHLIGVNGVELSELGALNLALAAVNLAESAGISRHGISHRTRADIYINAALRAKFGCKYFGTLSYAYFMRRAKRHVRKAEMIDGADVRALQWIFHPLACKFLKSHADVVTEILRSSKRPLNFPFSNAQISPKPMECLTNAFKMHLLSLLMQYLSELNASSRGTFTDFVEVSHLLLEICTSSPTVTTYETRKSADLSMLDWGAGECDNVLGGDELCTWWTHLITGGLYWRHGDNVHAQKHYAIVRKCPKKLLNNDLALSMGLAFCARKMCYDDRLKKNFTEMVWIHAQKSFQHLEKDNFSLLIRKSPDIVSAVQKCCRAITCEWIMTSLLDIWNHQLHASRPCWQHCAPDLVQNLYNATYRQFESCDEFADERKLTAFKVLENGGIQHKTIFAENC